MKQIIAVLAAALLAACGVETAGTAATAAAVKKQELEQGKKTMDQAQEKVGKAVEQMQQNVQRADEPSK